ncbi:class I SAM-dependent methyltransferase, partial [bacterium]|nr:class I SAM-dependent methyltransferase [bacterium]
DIVNIPKYPDITSAYGFYEAYLNQLIINEKFISLRDKNFNSTVDKIFISKNNRICLNPEYFKFYHGSAESIPSETETFDCVLSQAVMEHLSNPEGVIKEIKRVLKPKGFSFHQIDLRDHRDFNKPFEHLYLSRIKWNKEQESLDFCSGNQYRGIEFKNWFERQGFTIQSYITHYNNENSKCCEPLEINRIHDDFKHFDPTELASLGCFILAEKV